MACAQTLIVALLTRGISPVQEGFIEFSTVIILGLSSFPIHLVPASSILQRQFIHIETRQNKV